MRRDNVKSPDDSNEETRTVSSTILHSVVEAEKAFINAVREEVDTLFHDKDHEHKGAVNEVKHEKAMPVSHKRTFVIKKNENNEGVDEVDAYTLNHFRESGIWCFFAQSCID